MLVPSSIHAMRTQRIGLFVSLVMSLWHKLRDSQDCGADCC